MQHHQTVPCHLITGFLGSGKTTLIQQLLQQKPEQQTWAVLSNEFGEIGLDASILSAQQTSNVVIKEVPGGCLCCAAGVPFQVALNALLKQATPQRLFIEPTGLGHPQQIKKRLQELAKLGNISLATSLALIDARRLADQRYREHEHFAAQLRIADKLIASKADLYQQSDRLALERYLKQLQLSNKPLLFSQHGQLALDELSSPLQQADNMVFSPINEQQISIGLEAKQQHLELESGTYSLGWSFPANQRFKQQALVELLTSLKLLRCKALVQVEQASLLINLVDGEGAIQPLAPSETNRIELISAEQLNKHHLQQQLAACIAN